MKRMFGASAVALCLGLGAGPALAQGIERGADDLIDTDEAIAQSERRFDVIDLDDTGALSLDELGRGLSEADDPDTIFREMDVDRDLSITGREWMDWREQRLGELTEGVDGMSRRDFQTFDRGGAIGTADLGGDDLGGDLDTSGGLGTSRDFGTSGDLGTSRRPASSGDLGSSGSLGGGGGSLGGGGGLP